jgi:hypothetical protein
MSENLTIYISWGIFGLVWYILMAIGCMGEFKKAKVSTGKAFIPLLREVELFNISWKKPKMGIIWLACAAGGIVCLYAGSAVRLQIVAWLGAAAVIAAVVLMIMRDVRQSHAFGGRGGMTAGLILLNPIFNLVIGKNMAEYKGAL